MMIINDDARVVNKLVASLTDDARVVIYNHHMFIVQATVVACSSNYATPLPFYILTQKMMCFFTATVTETGAALRVLRLGADHGLADGHARVVEGPTFLTVIMTQHF
jgi:hypothetical protein